VKRRFRLRNSSEIKRVRRTGKSFAHPLIVLQTLAGKHQKVRVGIVASRSIGNAVKRNYAKRILREAVRPYLPCLTNGWDLVFVARSGILSADFQDVASATKQLLSKTHLLVDEND
jgi:ribonuclease P protein component